MLNSEGRLQFMAELVLRYGATDRILLTDNTEDCDASLRMREEHRTRHKTFLKGGQLKA